MSKFSELDIDKQSDGKKLLRQIEDYLRKYATEEQLNNVGKLLGVIK